MLWKKLISSIGIDDVKVDTLITKKEFKRGEWIEGKIKVTGGVSDKKIQNIIVTLIERYEEDKEDSDFSYHEKELSEHILSNLESIHSGEETFFPFRMKVPEYQELTHPQAEMVLRTKLMVENCLDPMDEDVLDIV